jgi:hypothetical protein
VDFAHLVCALIRFGSGFSFDFAVFVYPFSICPVAGSVVIRAEVRQLVCLCSHASNPEHAAKMHTPSCSLWGVCREAADASSPGARHKAGAAVIPLPGARFVWEIGGQSVLLCGVVEADVCF